MLIPERDLTFIDCELLNNSSWYAMRNSLFSIVHPYENNLQLELYLPYRKCAVYLYYVSDSRLTCLHLHRRF